MSGYASAEALRQALTDRAHAVNDEQSVGVEKRLRQFAYRRFLARVFINEDDGWILKGGVALLGRLADARHSRDIDLARRTSSIDEAIAELEMLIERDLGDYFEFRMGRVSRALSGAHEGATVPVVAYLGIKEFVRFNVDIVTDVDTTTEPEMIKPVSVIELPGISDRAWRTYPLVDHIADKFAAMLETHGDERTVSSRYRDLVDVVLIARSTSIDGALLRRAILTELRLRNIGVELPVKLPDSKPWRAGYRALLRELPGADVPFDEALEISGELFSIIGLDGTALVWDPMERQWKH